MSTQLKYLGQLLLFGGFLLLTYPVLISVGKTALPNTYMRNVPYPVGGYGHMHTRVREAANAGKVDILFLGSSHAYRGFDTRLWAKQGFSSFNLGSSAQSPIQSELLLKSTMKNLDPDVIIMEVNPILFSSDGVESALDLIANRPIDLATVGMVVRENHIKTTNALFYGTLRQTLDFDDDLIEAAQEDDGQYIPGGFVERIIGQYQPEAEAEQKENEEYVTEQIEAFDRIVQLAQRTGKKLILVEAPVPHFTYAHMLGPQREFEQFMASRRAVFLNMNDKVALTDTLHFTDGHHLNQAGVELFNAALIDTLIERGWLEQRDR
ncbi:MAG: hypothetical protein IPI00_15985 [Flavobacteriales bacterium]|nr:hypothetical protein [Flavobacteriales bacterium]MBK7241622.1 hypothetical protein [Flavobacteriales bacterium]MBK9534937.1 hypothetical protein [Flavobacteriales bacterium]MBP9138493.1 hypothetical protein [Flavobacteriales bacterium]HQV51310.1 hypothetical protein [Flavobacteriales bacterium]